MFWTQYSSHGKKSNARTDSPSNGASPSFPTSVSERTIVPIQNATPQTINAQSTSEIAPILNAVHRRVRFAPAVFVTCLAVIALALISSDNRWINLSALFVVIFIPLSVLLDRYRRSIAIKYEFQGVANTVVQTLADTFGDLKACSRVWNVTAEGGVDRKRHAGANTQTLRKTIYPRLDRPQCIRGSINFPALKLGRDELYFIPDAILVVTRSAVAALAYQELVFSNTTIQFIETDPVPRDATVVRETWLYVNKHGGPDRRFRFNKTLPVCSYGQMELKSNSGLNCKIEYSDPSKGDRFSKAISILHRPDSHIQSKPIVSAKASSNWPSVVFGFFFLAIGGGLVGSILMEPNTISSLRNLATFKQNEMPNSNTGERPKADPAHPIKRKPSIQAPLVITPDLKQ